MFVCRLKRSSFLEFWLGLLVSIVPDKRAWFRKKGAWSTFFFVCTLCMITYPKTSFIIIEGPGSASVVYTSYNTET